MAIEIFFESRELTEEGEAVKKDRHLSTDMEDVETIKPQGNKVIIHMTGEAIMLPFNRVHKLSIPLEQETVEEITEE